MRPGRRPSRVPPFPRPPHVRQPPRGGASSGWKRGVRASALRSAVRARSRLPAQAAIAPRCHESCGSIVPRRFASFACGSACGTCRPSTAPTRGRRARRRRGGTRAPCGPAPRPRRARASPGARRRESGLEVGVAAGARMKRAFSTPTSAYASLAPARCRAPRARRRAARRCRAAAGGRPRARTTAAPAGDCRGRRRRRRGRPRRGRSSAAARARGGTPWLRRRCGPT